MIGCLLARPRLIAYGLAGAALAGALAWAGLSVRSAYRAKAALPIARAERDAAIATIKRAGEEAERNARIANDYHDQLGRLRADLRARPITVRVCPKSPETVLPPRTAPRTDAPAPGPETGETAPAVADAYFADLTPYAEDAAGCADQLRALQRWVTERP